jgi:hypothetical protein
VSRPSRDRVVASSNLWLLPCESELATAPAWDYASRASACSRTMDRERPWLSVARRSPVAPMWPRAGYPAGSVPSGCGRLRRSGPPRPGTDRPAGHGKVDASLDQSTPAPNASRAGSSLGEAVIDAGHDHCCVVRGCPLGTGHNLCEWHAICTAGEDGPWHTVAPSVHLDRGSGPSAVITASLAEPDRARGRSGTRPSRCHPAGSTH